MLADACTDCEKHPDHLCDACRAKRDSPDASRPLIDTLNGVQLQDHINNLLGGQTSSPLKSPLLQTGTATVQNLRGNGMLADAPKRR